MDRPVITTIGMEGFVALVKIINEQNDPKDIPAGFDYALIRDPLVSESLSVRELFIRFLLARWQFGNYALTRHVLDYELRLDMLLDNADLQLRTNQRREAELTLISARRLIESEIGVSLEDCVK